MARAELQADCTMKIRAILIVASLFILSSSLAEASAQTKARPVLSLCEGVTHWQKYHGRKVRLRAVYEEGAGAWLYDPACQDGRALTYVKFSARATGAVRKLETIAERDKRAMVIIEGIFYGPAPFEKIDPKLPEKIRKGLEQSHQRYGHLDSFDTMINVTRVIKVDRADGISPSKG